MRTHEKTHPRIYECYECKQHFKEFNHLTRHIKSHWVSEKPFKCSICVKSFTIETNLMRHRREQHPERIRDCEYCDESFRTKIDLKDHVSKFHGNKLNTHRCNVCAESFPLKSLLIAHTETKHKPVAEHLCSECGKVYPSAYGLKAHLHSHSQAKPFACQHCPSTFRFQSNLNRHLFTHTGERNFFCDVCNKAFFSNDDMRKHRSEFARFLWKFGK